MKKLDQPLEFNVQQKIDLINSGKLPTGVVARKETPDILSRTELALVAEAVLDDSYINWPNKMNNSSPGPIVTGYDFVNSKPISGINFASQDYMSMCTHPGNIKATIEAVKASGTHSGGSPLFFGKTPYYLAVIQSLKDAFKKVYPDPHASIFSAGWMAGFGVISSLAYKSDHIVIDELCHNCLQFGAKASGSTLHKIPHLDNDAYCAKIAELREKYPQAGIMAVTEGLFSMDSDSPDLVRIQQWTKKHNALLVVDCAHDMFGVGQKGLGIAGDRLTEWDNVVLLGSGSKSLSNNFGWCVSNKSSLPKYLNYYSGSLTFSNALAPGVAASVKHNIDLLMSKEGDERRIRSRRNVHYVRKRLTDAGYEIIGDPSPIVIVLIGSEFVSRSIANMLYEEGIILNSVEYPACAQGDARLRLQIQCDHTIEQLDALVDALLKVQPKVDEYLENDNFVKVVSASIMKSQEQQKL